MSVFQHTPLNQNESIRLLLLHPSGTHHAVLRGSLCHYNLNDHYGDIRGGYTALSYVWGDAEKTEVMLLDDKEFQITANLAEALRNIRDDVGTYHIWADALCIDQRNISERNTQVAMMGDIYSSAMHTIIYLGPLTAEVDAVFRAVMSRTVLQRSKDSEDPPAGTNAGTIPLDSSHEHYIENGSRPSSTPELASAVAATSGSTSRTRAFPSKSEGLLIQAGTEDLLTRPWFRRVWTLQELALSNSPWIQCSRKRIRWADLCRLFRLGFDRTGNDKYFRPPKGKPHTNFRSMESIRASFHEPLSDSRHFRPRQLVRILKDRHGSQATDPRDMLFAHMGLIADQKDVNRYLKIDYTASISDVFVAAGRYALDKFCHVSSITDRISSSPLRSHLPSWVPDWGIDSPWHQLPPLASSPPSGRSGRELLRDVLVLGRSDSHTIAYVTDCLPPAFEYPKQYSNKVRETTSNAKYLNSEHIIDLWAAFIEPLASKDQAEMEHDVGSGSSFRINKTYSGVNDFAEAPYSDFAAANPHSPFSLKSRHHLMCEFFSGVDSKSRQPLNHNGCRLARLENGVIMMVPAQTRAGDAVVHLSNLYRKVDVESSHDFYSSVRESHLFVIRPLNLDGQASLDAAVDKHFRSLRAAQRRGDIKIERPEFAEPSITWELATQHCSLIGRSIGDMALEETDWCRREGSCHQQDDTADKKQEVYRALLAAIH
ncbi:hypothetical protein JX266_006733 [Neoarthrinium moseri]|nr:hypothetical protein JX266_006733 [Neoarthrinium moseri]